MTLTHICSVEFDSVFESFSYPTVDYIEMLNRMLPTWPFYNMDNLWLGYFYDYHEMFTRIYTNDGICYTFNGLKVTDLYRESRVQYQRHSKVDNATIVQNGSLNWSMDKGYALDSNLETYPARVLNAGLTGSLTVFLRSIEDHVDYTCEVNQKGFKVLLHSPDDVPVNTKHSVHVSVETEMRIAVKPQMMITSADVAAYEPHKRQCYMNMERNLTFFKVYNQNNCELECLTNYTLKECGCVPFAMPRTPEMPICSHQQILCYFTAMFSMNLKQFSQVRVNVKPTHNIGIACNCMPTCTSVEYDAETSEGILYTEKFLSAIDYLEAFKGENIARLVIYFKKAHFVTSRRSELYGFTELLANFGGVFGLFMGVSLLSVIEIFYHCTLRLWSNMMR